jgi:hypothetical protein
MSEIDADGDRTGFGDKIGQDTRDLSMIMS